MNAVRLLVLSVAICALPISELAQNARTTALIRMDLYYDGYRADRAGDYVAALKKLSVFWNVNGDQLTAATSSKEIAFRASLEATLKQLQQKIRRKGVDKDERSNLAVGLDPEGGSARTGPGTSGSASTSGNTGRETQYTPATQALGHQPQSSLTQGSQYLQYSTPTPNLIGNPQGQHKKVSVPLKITSNQVLSLKKPFNLNGFHLNTTRVGGHHL